MPADRTLMAGARQPMASAFDVAKIRQDFPILGRSVYGKPLVYLDNAASAQKPQAVLDALQRAYGEEYANVHRGLHFLSNAATDAYEEARKTTARFLNAPSDQQIIFTKNATEAINLVAQSFGGMRIGEGDEIVLTIMEHHSNIVPWHFHRERRGAKLKWVPVTAEGEFRLEDFEAALSPRTKMVAITHMSNVLGTRGAGEGSHAACPCARHPGAGRRQPGRGAFARGRAGHRLRFLRLHRS